MDAHSISTCIKCDHRADSGTKLASVLLAPDRMDPYSIATCLKCDHRTYGSAYRTSVLDRICSLSYGMDAYAGNVTAEILRYYG